VLCPDGVEVFEAMLGFDGVRGSKVAIRPNVVRGSSGASCWCRGLEQRCTPVGLEVSGTAIRHGRGRGCPKTAVCHVGVVGVLGSVVPYRGSGSEDHHISKTSEMTSCYI
jgi:hypothetical protein